MADIGRITLIAALLLAVCTAAALVICEKFFSQRFATSCRRSIYAVTALYTLSMAIMMFAFFTRNYSFKIVADHANQDMPLIYTFSAIYADKAGSVFFWGWLISLFTSGFALQTKYRYWKAMPYALAILAALVAFFLALVALESNVFEKSLVVPADGFGLNPLLQNVGMLLHPPILYLGFAGFAVVFAMMMAALITRTPAGKWINMIRGWMLFAWFTLGAGNLIGMWWSYNELGWGGYWAWDPVENAGLMPWLLGTAFVHSVAMRRYKNYLHTWSIILIILTFAFTLFSPFITHGGIESPLHGFYGSTFPPYILGAILITVVGSMVLLYIRHRDFEKEQIPSSFISREGAFLITNIMLVLLVIIIFSGTVAPRLMELLTGTKIGIDRSFFDRSCGPIMLTLVFIMGICPLLSWSRTSWSAIKRNFRYTFFTVLIIAVIVLVSGCGYWYSVIAIICGLPVLTIFLEWWRGAVTRRRNTRENCFRAFLSLINSHRVRYGGYIIHISIVLITIGIVGSTFYNAQKTITLRPGESININQYSLTYNKLIYKADRTKMGAVADISLKSKDKPIGSIYPEYNYWFKHKDSFAEVSVRSTLVEDLFISMVWAKFDFEDKAATFRILVNPLVIWMWIGGGVLLFGFMLAFWPENRQSHGNKG